MPPRQSTRWRFELVHVKHKEVDFVEAQEVEWVQWIMRSLLELVFARGSQGGKRDPFLRVWFPVNQPSCIVYMHKLATFGGLKQRLGRLGLLPVSLRSGDTNREVLLMLIENYTKHIFYTKSMLPTSPRIYQKLHKFLCWLSCKQQQ